MPTLLMSSAVLLAAASGPVATEVAMFEQVDLFEGPKIYTIGVLEDTRCPNRELCFREESLVVATVVFDGNRRTGIGMEQGVPLRIAGGWLTLVSTSAQPRQNGSIPLSEYTLTYLFEPDS